MSESQTEPQTIDLTNVKAGYLVMVDQDRKLKFLPLGTDAGIIELLGLHEYARHHIENLNPVQRTCTIQDVTKRLNALESKLTTYR